MKLNSISRHESNHQTRTQDRQGWQERVGPLLKIIRNRGIKDIRRKRSQRNRRLQVYPGQLSEILYCEAPAFLLLKNKRRSVAKRKAAV